MAKVECRSAQSGVPSVFVEIENITDAQVRAARNRLGWHIWHHVIYRHLLSEGWSDAKWKRVSGFALERALVSLYGPRLAAYDVRMRMLPAREANAILSKIGVKDTKSTKVDLFIEGKNGNEWLVFGSAHVKSSIAERVQDDVPASLALIRQGLLSILITMDAKSYPPRTVPASITVS